MTLNLSELELLNVYCLLLEQSGGVLTSIVAYCSTPALVLELLPAILAVVQPALRPVNINTQLFLAR